MISSELIRRYPFFEGLNHDQIEALTTAAQEITAKPGHYFFREGDTLRQLFLVIDGRVDILVSITDRSKEQAISEQLMGNFVGKDVAVSTIGVGQIFAWSALIPPRESTASARARTPCKMVAFDCDELARLFEEDRQFGYLMLQKVAVVIRQRLRDMRIQSLAFVPA